MSKWRPSPAVAWLEDQSNYRENRWDLPIPSEHDSPEIHRNYWLRENLFSIKESIADSEFHGVDGYCDCMPYPEQITGLDWDERDDAEWFRLGERYVNIYQEDEPRMREYMQATHPYLYEADYYG